MANKSFVDCKVIIYDYESKRLVAEATVLEHDRALLTITVDNRVFAGKEVEQVSLLILAGDIIYEYEGNIRKANARGRRPIALHHGQQKEDRAATRYIVNLPARVETVLIAGKPVALRSPLEVVVVNISTEGVLIRTAIGALNIRTSFQLQMTISESDTVINSCVARIQPVDSQNAEYGCKFISVAK